MIRVMIGSHYAMAEDLKVQSKRRSTGEFLAALERSKVLPAAQWQAVRDRFVPGSEHEDSLGLAKQLIKEEILTEFQARRLLTGRKTLEFGRYLLLDHLGQGSRGRVFKARHRLMDRVVALKVFLPDHQLSRNAVA